MTSSTAVRGGASLIAFVLGGQPLLETGFRIVGAHTDSPNLRMLLLTASPAQRERYLAPYARGETTSAIAISEHMPQVSTAV